MKMKDYNNHYNELGTYECICGEKFRLKLAYINHMKKCRVFKHGKKD